MLRRLPLVLSALMAAGCGGTPGALTSYVSCTETPEGYSVCEPSGAVPPGGTPPPPPVPVRASATELAGVVLGTEQALAVPALTAVLGEAEVEEQPCLRPALRETLAQPRRGSALRWDGLTAYLTPDADGRARLSGWELRHPHGPWQRHAFSLPYGVRLGDEVERVLRELPAPSTRVPSSGREAGVLAITTPREPGLEWRSYDRDGSGEVEEVAYDPEGCG